MSVPGEMETKMKEGIHPKYVESSVTCACGSAFKTRSTKPVIKLDICSACHPFFTGKQKLVDSAGMVDRFKKKYKEVKVSTARVKKVKLTFRKPSKKKLTTAPKKAKKAAAEEKKDTGGKTENK